MFDKFSMTDQVLAILRLADEEARSFRHEYIGTEHLLLGLLREGEGIAATVLRSRGVDLSAIRREIEQLVQQGKTEVTQQELPLTPRAREALEFAQEDARIVGQTLVDTEHVLIGLLREPDGVARIVLRKLGLELTTIGAEVFKIRFLQMKIVERVVRPLRAHIQRKRRIRDELLAHLSAIYDEELTHCNNPEAAVAAASKRFGNPVELTAELQATVPRFERWEARCDPLFGWRAPEKVGKWMTRIAIQLGLIMTFVSLLGTVFALRELGLNKDIWLVLRPLAALTIVTPIAVAVSGICYYEIRNSIFGVFGARKSWNRAISWSLLLAVAITGCGVGFLAMAYGGLPVPAVNFLVIPVWGLIWAAFASLDAYGKGPEGIRDTAWALLDLSD
jgi:Clp amino terminal domain, pathogenicity island component